MVGDLRMDYFDGRASSHRRTLRRLTLWRHAWSNIATPSVPLNSPELVDVVGDAMLFRGHVLESQDGRMYEHEQLWLVRPRDKQDGPALPAFDTARYSGRLPET